MMTNTQQQQQRRGRPEKQCPVHVFATFETESMVESLEFVECANGDAVFDECALNGPAHVNSDTTPTTSTSN